MKYDLHVKVDGYFSLEQISKLALSSVDKKVLQLFVMVRDKPSASKK